MKLRASVAMRLTTIVLTTMLGACGLGPRSDDNAFVTGVADDNQAMNEAMATARKTIGTFIERLEQPTPARESASLKARFDENGSVEHIWIGDVSYENGMFSGSLGNDPVSITSIKLGDAIRVPVERVSDWMLIENGKLVGGYTIRVMRDQASPEERKEIDAAMGFVID